MRCKCVRCKCLRCSVRCEVRSVSCETHLDPSTCFRVEPVRNAAMQFCSIVAWLSSAANPIALPRGCHALHAWIRAYAHRDDRCVHTLLLCTCTPTHSTRMHHLLTHSTRMHHLHTHSLACTTYTRTHMDTHALTCMHHLRPHSHAHLHPHSLAPPTP